ncbi:MAG: 30S ribosomal protein S2 [Acidimicrobiaceae bacterium]|nr:30S ribosomal protein S2 [Acidimicrobiaceae bacterium]
MAVVTMKQLLDAGVHFGHQTRRWNPKMKRFIHSESSGIHIIDLRQTLAHLEQAYQFVRDLVANDGVVLFVGTKKQAQESVRLYAERCDMPYVCERWLGGMLTNFKTISKRIAKMKEYQRMRDSGEFELMPKKEVLALSKKLVQLERNLGGISEMEEPPGAVFILDTQKEATAVAEARKLGVPIVALVDTNCDPDLVEYAIPGNDDAIRVGELISRIVSDAVQEGRLMRSKRVDGSDGSEAPSIQAHLLQSVESIGSAEPMQSARPVNVEPVNMDNQDTTDTQKVVVHEKAVDGTAAVDDTAASSDSPVMSEEFADMRRMT